MRPLDVDEGVVETRVIRGESIRFTEDERAFVMRMQRSVDGKVSSRRVYGKTGFCEECDQEFFSRSERNGRFCTIACSKLGNRNPTRKRPQQNKAHTCDKLFGAIVRSSGWCMKCGRSTHLQCAHGFSRRYRNIRWDRRNAFCLCRGCHLYYTHRPIEWDNWLREEWGEDLYDELRMLAVDTTTKPDLDALLLSLRETYDGLGLKRLS